MNSEVENKDLEKKTDSKADEILEELQQKLELCSRCGLCKELCPVFNTLLNEAYSARGKNILINLKKIDPKVFYACSLCQACQEICPSKLDLVETFRNVRKYLVKQGIELKENREFIENMKKFDVPFNIEKEEHDEFYCC